MRQQLKINLIGFKTIYRKEVTRFLRIALETIVPPVITMTLYFIIFGKLLIGPRIGQINGFSYMQFIAPGLIMMSVINGSFMNVSFSFFIARFNKSIEEILVSPISNVFILLGYVFAGMSRGLLVGLLVSLTAMTMMRLVISHPLLMVLVILLSALLFGLLGFTIGAIAKNFDRISLIPTFILTPLTYLGGVFYSIDILPEFFQALSKLNPILYMVNAFRYSMLGISDVSIILSLGMIIFFIILFFNIAWLFLKKGYGVRS